MNVEVFARLKPVVHEDRRTAGAPSRDSGGSQELLNLLEGNGSTSAFQQVFKAADTNIQIYHSSLKQLLPLFISGLNASFIIIGSKGSGKSFTLAGDESINVGLFDFGLQQLFIEMGQHFATSTSKRLPALSLAAYEINGEDIVDLLAPRQSSSSQQPKLQVSSDRGTYVQNLTSVPVKTSSAGTDLFHQAWSSHASTSTAVIQLELNAMMPRSLTATRSYLSFIVIPVPASVAIDISHDSLAADTQGIRNAPSVVSHFTAVSTLVDALAEKPYADRVINYSGCALTKLLQDVLGGNCRTQLIMCFGEMDVTESISEMVQLAENFSKVKNFPIVNEDISQLKKEYLALRSCKKENPYPSLKTCVRVKKLLTQYRARLMQSKDSSATGTDESADMSQFDDIRAENVTLHDTISRLRQRVDELQKLHDELAASKADLTSQMLMTDDARVRMSKSLIDAQRESILLREDADAARYKLTRKVEELEIALADAKDENNGLARLAANSNAKLQEVEKRNKDITDKLARLELNNITLREAYDKLLDRNDKLSVELLKMFNSQSFGVEHSEAVRERERVRAVVNQLANRTEELRTLDDIRTSLDKPLFEAINKLQTRLDQERVEFEDEKNKMQLKIVELRTELNEARHQTREAQSKLSELNAQLLSSLSAKTALEAQVNKHQHKLKDVTDDYRSRLNKYIRDVAVHMDTRDRKATDKTLAPTRMDQYVDQMLVEMKRAHRIREDQLSSAAHSYKRRLEQVVRQHEVLLVAYSDLRQQVEARGLTDVELGPDEHKLVLYGEPELKSSLQQQIEKLQKALIQKQAELEALKLRMQMHSISKEDGDKISSDEAGLTKKLSLAHKELQDLMQRSENERARLLTDNAMLRQEVNELQEYVDRNLSKYQDDILRQRLLIEQLKLANSNVDGDRRTPSRLAPSPTINTRRRR